MTEEYDYTLPPDKNIFSRLDAEEGSAEKIQKDIEVSTILSSLAIFQKNNGRRILLDLEGGGCCLFQT